jgi:tetratricopeptide (TPR) repeat protein
MQRSPAAPADRTTRPRRALLGVLLGAALLVPGCVDAAMEHRVRANAFLRGGDAEAALRECDEGLARKRDDVPLLIMRGKALFELDRMADARTAYTEALAAGTTAGAEPRSLADAHLGLGMVASRQRDWAQARSSFSTLVAINDKDATSHLNVARACLELLDLPCAVEHGETAARLRGNEENVLYTLGVIYLAAGKPAEATLTFQHICDVAPGVASCPYGLSLVAAKAGDKARALAELREAVGRKVPNPDHIADDPGFASLRGDPEFAALVAKAGEK